MTDPDPDRPMLIHIDPHPPEAGKPCTIRYDFPPTPPPSSIELVVTYTPPSGSFSTFLYPTSDHITVTIPSAAITMEIADTSGFSPTLLVVVI